MHASFHYYSCFRIILRLWKYLADAGGLFVMAGGGICMILSNFTTVKLYRDIPMPLFLLFPTLAILCPVFGLLGIKVGSQCYEISKTFKRAWSRHFLSRDRNLMMLNGKSVFTFWKRKVSTLVPAAFNMGINDTVFCKLERSTSPNYWYEILSHSISAILSIQV